jgi:hypothetical protein
VEVDRVAVVVRDQAAAHPGPARGREEQIAVGLPAVVGLGVDHRRAKVGTRDEAVDVGPRRGRGVEEAQSTRRETAEQHQPGAAGHPSFDELSPGQAAHARGS